MKKVYTLLVMVLAVLVADAQSKMALKPETKSDPEARKILDAVSAKFKTFKTPQATFTYKVENAQGQTLSAQNGTVSMRGNKYRINMSGMDIFSDGRTSWNYDKSANEVTVSGVDFSGSGMTPQRLFTNFYDKDFYYKLNGEKKVGTKAVQEIELTPVDKSRPFHKVYVLIDKASRTIYSAKFLEKSGNRYSYTINTIKPNVTLSDADFVFDKSKFPGVEIVDLR